MFPTLLLFPLIFLVIFVILSIRIFFFGFFCLMVFLFYFWLGGITSSNDICVDQLIYYVNSQPPIIINTIGKGAWSTNTSRFAYYDQLTYSSMHMYRHISMFNCLFPSMKLLLIEFLITCSIDSWLVLLSQYLSMFSCQSVVLELLYICITCIYTFL